MDSGKPADPVAVVTGWAGAIGSEIARRLTADVARVVIADVDAEAAQRVAAGIPGAVA